MCVEKDDSVVLLPNQNNVGRYHVTSVSTITHSVLGAPRFCSVLVRESLDSVCEIKLCSTGNIACRIAMILATMSRRFSPAECSPYSGEENRTLDRCHDVVLYISRIPCTGRCVAHRGVVGVWASIVIVCSDHVHRRKSVLSVHLGSFGEVPNALHILIDLRSHTCRYSKGCRREVCPDP